MGNAIKHIRHIIAKTSIDAAEEDTKRSLCDAIDRFIDTYIVFAQEEIAKHGVEKLATDDVILTYSYYTAVKKVGSSRHHVKTTTVLRRFSSMARSRESGLRSMSCVRGHGRTKASAC